MVQGDESITGREIIWVLSLLGLILLEDKIHLQLRFQKVQSALLLEIINVLKIECAFKWWYCNNIERNWCEFAHEAKRLWHEVVNERYLQKHLIYLILWRTLFIIAIIIDIAHELQRNIAHAWRNVNTINGHNLDIWKIVVGKQL